MVSVKGRRSYRKLFNGGSGWRRSSGKIDMKIEENSGKNEDEEEDWWRWIRFIFLLIYFLLKNVNFWMWLDGSCILQQVVT